jgi:catechol 2,3-dioxygenase-like lactoylglutathione lyase family enzyme
MVALAALAGPVVAAAQTPVATLPYDHMHLATADRAKAIEWYVTNLGATHHELGDRVAFGKVTISWFERAGSPSSDGSVIDHIGFSYPDVAAKVAQLQAAGAKVTAPARDVAGLFTLAFVEDPWGVKIELVQDAERLGFHHIHLRLPDPEKALAWYQERFGGERGKLKGRIDGLTYDGLWLLVQKADGAPKSEGRAIDHLGWRVRDLETTLGASRAKGDKVTMEPRMIRDVKVGVIEDPNGVRIELAQRPVF